MNFDILDAELRLSRGRNNMQGHCGGEMEGRAKRTPLAQGQRMEYERSHSQGRAFPPKYFSIESFLVLIFLTASLLILPLVLPPLPPPPIMLLLLPVGMLALLVILAFMPSDARNIGSSSL